MRLYEATTKGGLAVPGHILMIEANLKRNWVKADRALKQALKNQPADTTPARGTKRKADPAISDSPNPVKSMTINPDGSVNIQFGGTAKKPKKATNTSQAASSKPAAPRGPGTGTSRGMGTRTSRGMGTGTSRGMGTAPRGRPSPRAGPSTIKTKAASPERPPPQAPRTKQTARRSGKYPNLSTRPPASSLEPSQPGPGPGYRSYAGYDDPIDFDDPPPPCESESAGHYDDHPDDGYGRTEKQTYHHGEPAPEPLGLLNGRHDVEIRQSWSAFGGSAIILTLDGSALWGSFDFGDIHGVFFLPSRPWQSSPQAHRFTWRGEDGHGDQYTGDNCVGEIVFYGGGRISGMIDWQGGPEFDGHRVVGQGTRSEISGTAMQGQWAGYC